LGGVNFHYVEVMFISKGLDLVDVLWGGAMGSGKFLPAQVQTGAQWLRRRFFKERRELMTRHGATEQYCHRNALVRVGGL
jgi:hypothetical protein